MSTLSALFKILKDRPIKISGKNPVLHRKKCSIPLHNRVHVQFFSEQCRFIKYMYLIAGHPDILPWVLLQYGSVYCVFSFTLEAKRQRRLIMQESFSGTLKDI